MKESASVTDVITEKQREAAVVLENVTRRFGRAWALKGVTLSVGRGGVVMVAGRNGSGKTTLLRLLAGAISADGGSGRVMQFDLSREREDVRRVSGLLSHSSYTYEPLTARENLDLVARGLRLRESRPIVEEVLGTIGLAGRADEPVRRYSAGMRKRVAIGRLLLQEPEVVLLDEPYAQLDPEGFGLIEALIASARRRGATVLIATHMIERAARLSDAALVLDGGRVRWSGPPSDVSQHAGVADEPETG